MFFDFDAAGVLFPTLYFTWIAPTVFPMLVVHEEVLHYLENGADLMLQGLCLFDAYCGRAELGLFYSI